MGTPATNRGFATGHVGLSVTSLERSIPFYQDVFGFEVLANSNDPDRPYAFLGRDSDIVLTLWPQSAAGAARDRAGLHHLSFQVPSIAHVEAAHERLTALGATIYHGGIVPHGEEKASGGLFFEDPDGIRLEIYAPTGADTRDAPTPGAPTCGFF